MPNTIFFFESLYYHALKKETAPSMRGLVVSQTYHHYLPSRLSGNNPSELMRRSNAFRIFRRTVSVDQRGACGASLAAQPAIKRNHAVNLHWVHNNTKLIND